MLPDEIQVTDDNFFDSDDHHYVEESDYKNKIVVGIYFDEKTGNVNYKLLEWYAGYGFSEINTEEIQRHPDYSIVLDMSKVSMDLKEHAIDLHEAYLEHKQTEGYINKIRELGFNV